MVAAKNEQELWDFKDKLENQKILHTEFIEPDIGDSLTAIAIVPSERSKELCKGFKLAGQGNNPTLNLNALMDAVEKMRKTEQTKGLSVFEHGQSVNLILFERLLVLNRWIVPETTNLEIRDKLLGNYPLPTWFTDRENVDIITANLPPKYILHKYTLFHDIGKPYCRVVDDEGKVHFPNHAEVSAKKYLELFPWEKEVAELIRQDMIIHTIKEEGMENFSRNKHAIALLLVGLAEVLSNAYMFGGYESESFKIKFKQIEKRGNSLFRKLKERNRENDC